MTTGPTPEHTPAMHILNARDNVLLQVMQMMNGGDESSLPAEVRASHTQLVAELKTAGVVYEELRGSLSPQTTSHERAFLFDSNKSGGLYGITIGNQVLARLPKTLSCSIIVGDIVSDVRNHPAVSRLFDKIQEDYGELLNCIYVVYLNNLSEVQVRDLDVKFCEIAGYVRSLNMTIASPLKNLLSLSIGSTYIKHKQVLISAFADLDRGGVVQLKVNEPGLTRDQFSHVGVLTDYYSLFLSYKIESSLNLEETDSRYSIAMLHGSSKNLQGLKVVVPDAKLEYVKKKKSGSMKIAQLEDASADEVAELIRKAIEGNYIYNLQNNEYGDAIFNVIVSIDRNDGRRVRLMAALKLIESSSTLSLVTFY